MKHLVLYETVAGTWDGGSCILFIGLYHLLNPQRHTSEGHGLNITLFTDLSCSLYGTISGSLVLCKNLHCIFVITHITGIPLQIAEISQSAEFMIHTPATTVLLGSLFVSVSMSQMQIHLSLSLMLHVFKTGPTAARLRIQSSGMCRCVKWADPEPAKDCSASESQEPVSHQGGPESSVAILWEPQT